MFIINEDKLSSFLNEDKEVKEGVGLKKWDFDHQGEKIPEEFHLFNHKLLSQFIHISLYNLF